MKELLKSIAKALLPTVLHVTELLAILLIVAFVSKVFHVSSEYTQATVVIVLSALTKLARTSDAIPVPDWVNNPPIQK